VRVGSEGMLERVARANGPSRQARKRAAGLVLVLDVEPGSKSSTRLMAGEKASPSRRRAREVLQRVPETCGTPDQQRIEHRNPVMCGCDRPGESRPCTGSS